MCLTITLSLEDIVRNQRSNQTKALDNLSKRHQSIGCDDLDVNTGLIKKQI